MSVIERGPDGESEVAFTSSEATALEDQREDEELRRLLYVAATRARDRLYFAAQLDARGQVRRSPRSLASLLPAPLLTAFGQAGASPDARVMWDTPHGSFAFRICRPVDRPAIATADAVSADEPALDVSWLKPGRPAPIAAAAAGEADAPGSASVAPVAPHERARGPVAHERLIGTLVHRLFQRDLDPDEDPAAVAGHAAGLLRVEERVDVSDLAALGRAAADLYCRLRQRADVRALLGSGQAWYEVPFSQRSPDYPDVVWRGVIDCLVVPEEGPPIVLEFKTGGPRPEHAVQVERYASAVREILGVNLVESKILYA